MSKFIVGDRVRITNALEYDNGAKWQPWLNGHEGAVVTVTDYREGSRGNNAGWFMTDADWGYGPGIWDGNAELVEEKTLDDVIAEAKETFAKVQAAIDKYEAALAAHEAKEKQKSVSRLPNGTHVLAYPKQDYDSEFVKVSDDSWYYIQKETGYRYSNGYVKIYRDSEIDEKGWKLK